MRRTTRRAAGAMGLAALLAACDQPAPRYRQARAPAPPPAPVGPPPAPSERPSPIAWDPARKAFVTEDGRALVAGRLWTFDGSAEGWTSSAGVKATPEPGGGLRVANGDADPILLSPKGLALDGERHPMVVVRLTRLAAGPAWSGTVFYSTATHGPTERFRGKPADGKDPGVNETVTLVYDMTQPGMGGPDWARGVIDQIRLDTDDGPGGAFVIRQVAIVERPPAKP